MNDKKWKEFLQKEMDKELEEIDGILAKMDQDPEMRDVVAPAGMYEEMMNIIHEKKAEEERLSEEEKELIRLGMTYKKTRKWAKVLIPLVAVVGAMAISVTCMGGPKQIIQKVQGMLEGREQLNNDSDEGRTKEIITISEVEAYEQIEDEFGFFPVTLDYFPKTIVFEGIEIVDNAQNAYLSYLGKNQESMIYSIYPNYRAGSIGRDVEDKLIDEYDKIVNDITVNVREYEVEGNLTSRYIAQFEYKNVYYVLRINNVAKAEVEKIIENLYFN